MGGADGGGGHGRCPPRALAGRPRLGAGRAGIAKDAVSAYSESFVRLEAAFAGVGWRHEGVG